MKKQAEPERPTRGRRPAGSQTREAIADAARRQFSEHGYRDTTLRSVAGEAGVDHRLVLHYFGSKRRLFREAIALPIDPELLLERIFDTDPDDVARGTATAMIGVLEDPATRQTALALIRAAASEPEAAALIREVLTERVLAPLTSRVGGDEPELRANMIATQFVGMAMARYVVRIEPLASASAEQVIAAITPVFEHYLYGDWTVGVADGERARSHERASGSPS